MFRKTALGVVCSIAALAGTPGGAMAQYAPFPASGQGFSPAPQFAHAPAPQPEPAAALPDDVRIVLMIRNTVLALNQANLTGNYSVLRDMGTPAFQMTNSQARLAEIFASLRGRKLDLSPVMVFNPKLLTPPALQDGQVLKLAGFFPTTPEQVRFEIAYQHYGEQWLLAGLAVSVSAPGEGPQASAGPAGQLMQSAIETSAPQAGAAKPGEAKPIRIDLSKPSKPKKPAAAKKTKPSAQPAQKTAAAQAPAEQSAAAAPAQAPAQAEPAEAKPAEKSTGFGASWNPFAR